MRKESAILFQVLLKRDLTQAQRESDRFINSLPRAIIFRDHDQLLNGLVFESLGENQLTKHACRTTLAPVWMGGHFSKSCRRPVTEQAAVRNKFAFVRKHPPISTDRLYAFANIRCATLFLAPHLCINESLYKARCYSIFRPARRASASLAFLFLLQREQQNSEQDNHRRTQPTEQQ